MIIGISGKMGSGKDTFAEMLQQTDPRKDWQIKKFSVKLKIIAELLTGIPMADWESQTRKKDQLGPEWSNMTLREMLQRIGTDAMRDGLHKGVWINALWADYKPLDDTLRRSMGNVIDYSDCPYPNWIVVDVRFPNEADSIKKRGGVLIRINRDIEGRINSDHPSETSMDNYLDFDYIINNNGSLDDLKSHVWNVLSLL